MNHGVEVTRLTVIHGVNVQSPRIGGSLCGADVARLGAVNVGVKLGTQV
jgi:hypothetical protein